MARRKYVKENNLVKAINTDSLELQKPLVNEYYDINVHNSNMDKIDKGYKQNKNDISNINYELSKTENTKYSTENGVKEFECKNGYVDNIVIEGQTKILNAENIEVEAGTDGAKLVSVGQGDKIEVLTYSEVSNSVTILESSCEIGKYIGANGELESVGNEWCATDFIEIKDNYIDFGKYLNPIDYWSTCFYDENKKFISNLRGGIGSSFDNAKPKDAKFLRTSIKTGFNSTDIRFCNKIDKKQILTTLGSLPNGVKDTIGKRGNKYVKVQRCEEVVLNGSEDWFKVGDIVQANTIQFGFKKGNDVAYKGDSEVFFNCDKIPPTEERNWQEDREFIFINPNDYIISISKTRLSIQDVAGFKTWLKSNPVTVAYELATPIIEELPNFNPQTFSDKTTLLLNSGVVQGEADFEVTNSLGSEIEVLKNKVSDLDDYVVEIEKINLLNGWSNIVNEAYVIKNKNVVTLSMSIGGGITTNATTIGVISDKFRPKSFKDGYSQFGCVSCDSGYVYSPATIVVWDNGKINADVITSNKRLVINASWYV